MAACLCTVQADAWCGLLQAKLPQLMVLVQRLPETSATAKLRRSNYASAIGLAALADSRLQTYELLERQGVTSLVSHGDCRASPCCVSSSSERLCRETLALLPSALCGEALGQWLLDEVRAELGAGVTLETELLAAGLDSLTAIRFGQRVCERLSLPALTPVMAFEFPTVAAIQQHVADVRADPQPVRRLRYDTQLLTRLSGVGCPAFAPHGDTDGR